MVWVSRVSLLLARRTWRKEEQRRTQREGMFRWIQGSQIVQPSFLQHQAEGRLTGLAAFGQNRLRPRGLRVRVLRVPAPTWKQVELVMRLSLYRVFDGLGHAARRRL